MKETKIAKENVKLSNEWIKKKPFESTRIYKIRLNQLITHKQTCQRWLDWISSRGIVCANHCDCRTCKKIKDLKQAIKIYDEAGI